MALINSLQFTTLKDFPKYEGYQPLIRKDIKNPPVYNSVSKQIEARGDDILRLAKLLTTGPGIKFLGNTASLNAIDQGRGRKPPQRDRVANSSSGLFEDITGFLGALFEGVAETALTTAAITASTIAQAATAGSGTHLVLGFKGKRGYLTNVQGHVLSGQGKEIPVPYTSLNTFKSELEFGDSTTYKQFGLKNFNNRYAADKYAYEKARNGGGNVATSVVTSIAEAAGVPAIEGRKLYDFTTPTYEKISKDIIKEERLGLGNTGGRGLAKYTKNYKNPANEAAEDKVNMLGPNVGANEEVTDFIKFNFEIIDPDAGEENTFLYFRAYLDAFSDSYTGTWNSHKYLGRAEDFYTYGGFERSISFGFKSAVQTRQELKPMYQKLVRLASTTAPSYSTDESYMRGTLVNVTIGDYLVSQPGFFSAVNYSWQTNYPWETKLDPNEATQQLPHILDCAVEFTPIHRFAPQTGGFHYFTNPSENKYFKQGEAVDTEATATAPATNFLSNLGNNFFS